MVSSVTLRLFALLALCSTASAAPVLLRIGTVVPDGSAWARELRAFQRDAERVDVKMKIYWGGIAGSEPQMIERARKGQLDGIAGASSCYSLSPSLRAARPLGMFASTPQASVLLRQIPHVNEEYLAAGFVSMGVTQLGPSIIFLKQPVKSWDELKRLRLWRWSEDAVGTAHAQLVGLNVVATPLESAMQAMDEGKIDGFIGLAASSLAFQWHARAPYVLPLVVDNFGACLLISARAWDLVPLEAREEFKAAAAKLEARMELVGQEMDKTVMSGSLVGRGITVLPVSDELRRQFREAAKKTRHELVAKGLIPQAAFDFMESQLAEQKK
jgi:TRAP-type C4-dicarboxylate transport system substrate-binding protein